jgi:hypothetical protein
MQGKTLYQLLTTTVTSGLYTKDVKKAIRNQGGGAFNHIIYFQVSV